MTMYYMGLLMLKDVAVNAGIILFTQHYGSKPAERTYILISNHNTIAVSALYGLTASYYGRYLEDRAYPENKH